MNDLKHFLAFILILLCKVLGHFWKSRMDSPAPFNVPQIFTASSPGQALLLGIELIKLHPLPDRNA